MGPLSCPRLFARCRADGALRECFIEVVGVSLFQSGTFSDSPSWGLAFLSSFNFRSLVLGRLRFRNSRTDSSEALLLEYVLGLAPVCVRQVHVTSPDSPSELFRKKTSGGHRLCEDGLTKLGSTST